MKRWRIGIVVPRYGKQILGGAETLARGFAEQATAHGIADVSIFTTCAVNHITWENELAPGQEVVNEVPVYRFPIDQQIRDEHRYHALHGRIINWEKLSVEEQIEWVHHSAHSPELYGFLETNGSDFDFLFFVPYLFGTTYYGSAIHPDRSILWPCLHDEVYAYLTPTRDMYRGCLGVMFNTYPELKLAQRLYGFHPGAQEVGFGLEPIEVTGNRLREKNGLTDPFILYSGRFEGAKNLPMLVNYFLAYKQHRDHPLKLVMMGRGPEPIPDHPDIISVGFLIDQKKNQIFRSATILCQPSINESFSIVMMEAWLSGAPVVVHADCEVTRYNVVRSNGGLYFRGYEEFEGVLDLLLSDERLRLRLAENGKQFVQSTYTWQAVLERFEKALWTWDRLKSS